MTRDGQVIQRRGVTDVPGLYFLGLPWQHTRGSALLGFVHEDAAYLAGRITGQDRAGEAAATRPVPRGRHERSGAPPQTVSQPPH